MPELPEVETMRRGIAAMAGLRIAAVTFPRGPVRPISVRPHPDLVRARLVGRVVAAVHRFGKRVAIEIAAAPAADAFPEWLVIEPRMTGQLLVVDPPSRDHVRMELHLASRRLPRVVFWDRRGLGTIRLLDRAGLDAACGPAKLGPDGLAITGADLHSRLGRARRQVKVALLDQRAVAGIGNIYAAELLFRACIDPRPPCRRITAETWERIAAETRRVLATAVRLEGSTIGDATYKTAHDRPGRFQRQHRVYARDGKPCRRCGGGIERIVQAQRSTFFCPQCQWRPGRRCRTL
jgi:formamidopyrimidine-DNA glycosylase